MAAPFFNILYWNSRVYKGFSIKTGHRQAPSSVSSKIMGHILSKKTTWKFQNFILVLGVRKIDFYDFSGKFLRKNGLEYGITSETTETRDPRVRRRKPGKPASRQALHVVTDFPFYGFLRRPPRAGHGIQEWNDGNSGISSEATIQTLYQSRTDTRAA